MELQIPKADRDKALQRLVKEIDKHGSQLAFARAHGVNHSLVSQVMTGRIDPPPTVLAAIGLRRVVHYEEVAKRKQLRKKAE